MNMRTMCRIREDMRSQGYDLPDSVGKTSYRCNYTPDSESYLSYGGLYIDSLTNFSYDPVSHDNLPHILFAFPFSSSNLPSPENTKLSHRSLSLHSMIKS